MHDLFIRLIFKVSGHAFNPDLAARAPYILQGLVFVAIFTGIFIYLYYKYFWKELMARKLFFWSVSILFSIVLAKYAINYIFKGYISDRLLFYGLPSPRVQGFLWFIFPCLVFLLFFIFRKKIESLPRWKFLGAMYLIFVLFCLSVAGLREGWQSIMDPFTRTKWEYSGNITLIQSVRHFLENYMTLIPQDALHRSTHPPGYSLVLYFFHKVFEVGFLGQAVLLVLSVGGILIPLYYLWLKFFPEWKVRRFLEIFIFTPAVVMFTATSMDAFMMLIVWMAITLCYFGWRRNIFVSALAGVVIGYGFFSNFLFALLAPAFLLIFWYVMRNPDQIKRSKVLFRVTASFGGFLLFFSLLYLWSRYSIVNNFFAANTANSQAVESNFKSAGTYFIYFLMNVIDFIIYFGLPMAYFVIRRYKNIFTKNNWLVKIGLINLIFLLVIGIFQGEIERIWLFMVPFFVIMETDAVEKEETVLFPIFLMLMFFQIIIMQVLFYTYW